MGLNGQLGLQPTTKPRVVSEPSSDQLTADLSFGVVVPSPQLFLSRRVSIHIFLILPFRVVVCRFRALL
jgi:hypothetical protein